MFFRSGCKGLFVNKPQIIPKGRTAVSPCVTTFSFSQFQACSTPCESHGQAGYQLIFYFERTTQVFINVQISDWIYYTCEFSTFSTLLAEQTYSCDNWTCWSEADEVQQDIATCCLRSGLPLKIDLPVQTKALSRKYLVKLLGQPMLARILVHTNFDCHHFVSLKKSSFRDDTHVHKFR